VFFWIAGVTTYAQDVPSTPSETAEPAVMAAPAWTATVGGGLALASGNTDALSYNFALDMAYGRTTGNLLKWTSLYLRGTQNDVLTVNRLSVAIRNEYTFSPRVFAFARIEYLHDTFKRIDYFAAPAIGLGYKVVETPRTRFSIDLGGGSVTERNLGNSSRTTSAVQAGETLQHQLTRTAAIKQAISAVWNTNDVGSSLYTGSVGIATQVSSRLQLSVDLLDTFKTRPPTAATERNDVNLIVAITAKY
jgi:putative salt-induced outer membrane protein YdiY